MAQYNKNQDPHRDREHERYENPVPSREYILKLLEQRAKPIGFSHIFEAFDLSTPEEKEGLRRRLLAMLRDGQLIQDRRGNYALVSKIDLIRGRVQGHRDGFGFLVPDDGSDDIFLPSYEMCAVFTDDVVLLRVTKESARRREGSIVEVLEHNTQRIVGRYFEENGIAFIDPDNKSMVQDIMIAPQHTGQAQPGQFVVAEIIAQPTKRRQALGRIVEILGDQLTPGMEVELSIRSHNLPFIWPDEVVVETAAFGMAVMPHEIEVREDLRALPFVTIDGEDAQDFDDAVYAESFKNGSWDLWVAIADVSHYVLPDSAMDKEAIMRGNSVYFPSKVIPMLPENLSNHLCSLKPHEDRLAMVCKINIDKKGKIKHYEFLNAVIHSQARLSYTEVAAMLHQEQATPPHLDAALRSLNALYHILQSQRTTRGAVEFNTVETKIRFNDKGKIDQIVPLIRNDAHRLIEEMMLVANICAADFLLTSKINAIYRVHEGPKPQKLVALRQFLAHFDLRLMGGKKPKTKDYSTLLARINQREDAHLLQTVLLRSLQQAVYSPKNQGHFGLAYDAYTHFTSPIRRYPDLLVHRAIKYVLSKKSIKHFMYDIPTLEKLALQCSTTERRADRATRDATDWLKCDFMRDKVGQSFKGRIVEVTSFGVFVELESIYIQGLLHITQLKNDYYHYDETLRLLQGKRTNQTYRLADKIQVTVARVDLNERLVEFSLPMADSPTINKRTGYGHS